MSGATPPPAAGRPGSGDGVVALRNVSKAYAEGAGRRAVFRGIDATIQRGEFVMLVGRSGSGKTTLLNLISGIDLADEGEVWVAGRELSRMTERERTCLRRDHVGFVFQFFDLIPSLTVEENLLLPIELKHGLGRGAEERAREMLARVGLADRARAWPDRLSGGEKQRVAIARALAHDPDLVLADEPTGNLDEESAAEIVALLEALLRPARKTLLLVTHDTDLLRIADRVLHVHEGRLVEEPRAR
jgi:putative ABC transport system ATP-binding protein